MIDRQEGWLAIDPNPPYATRAIATGEADKVRLDVSDLFESLRKSDATQIEDDRGDVHSSDFQGRGFVLVHNHPGGSPRPSDRDHGTTMLVSHIGKVLGIPLVDHWIFFRDEAGDLGMFAYSSELPGFLEPSILLTPGPLG